VTTLPTEAPPVTAADHAVSPAKKKPRVVGTTAWYVVALFICAVMIVPLLWMITIGLNNSAVFSRSFSGFCSRPLAER